ncbi:MAG: hypothetical protein HRT71_08445 [Flavobacteriales bacterium]|nr:hypothetical protein [Flavobacteriales bacterium]
MGRKDKGTWELADNGIDITIISHKGRSQEIQVNEVTKDRMILTLGKAKMIMKRAEPTEEDNAIGDKRNRNGKRNNRTNMQEVVFTE